MTEANIAFTDTHCHLDFVVFKHDREAVVGRAREAGLNRLLNPGIDIETSKSAILMAEQYPEIYAAIGIHPNDALSWNAASHCELEELSRHPKVVAIGEIGLDNYRNAAPVEVQKRVFIEQLELAGNLGLPVVIHNRNASDEMRKILGWWAGSLAINAPGLVGRPGVLHSYSGDLEFAEWAVATNFSIGVTGPVTYRSAAQLQQTVMEIPLERILIETDAPFLPPHPHRGERNEPAHVSLIAGKIAELRAIDLSEIARCTSENAARLFRWSDTD